MSRTSDSLVWIPAFAGMTLWVKGPSTPDDEAQKNVSTPSMTS